MSEAVIRLFQASGSAAKSETLRKMMEVIALIKIFELLGDRLMCIELIPTRSQVVCIYVLCECPI